MIRFIHTADIHLDSPLTGLAAYEGAPTDLLRTATRAAFSQLVDAALRQSVDFVVIAGDLYDGDWRDYNTGFFFCREMGRLRQAGIPVFLLYGNHDAESEITQHLRLPDNVKAFSARRAETFRIDALKIALHGRSFRNAATTENLVVGYPDPVPGWLNIGVLHTALEGNAAHAAYAPCSLAQLEAKGFDYWALGHVHEHAVLCESPSVVFPGNLQGRHIRECGPRGAVLVTAVDHRIFVERLFVDVLRWHHLAIDAFSARTLEDAVRLAADALQSVLQAYSDGRTMAVRVTFSGPSEAHGALFGLEPQLRAEILALANALGTERVWVEKVCVATSPALDPEAVKARSDALADLQAMLEAAEIDADLLSGIGAELGELISRAPRDLVECVPDLHAIRKGEIAPIVKRIAPDLVARLAADA
jgi:predicted phosphodiesterase